MRVFVLSTLCVTLGGAIATQGCGDRHAGAPDAGADAAPVDAAVDAQPEARPCVPVARPTTIPKDWREVVEFAPCSGIYIPESTSSLPPSRTWEPCADANPAIAGCERVALPTGAVQASLGAAALPDGVYLVLGYGYGDRTETVVARADGAVVAAAAASTAKWSLATAFVRTISGSRYLIEVSRVGRNVSGYLVGEIGDVAPRFFKRYGDPEYGADYSHDFTPGSPGVLHYLGQAAQEILDPATGEKRVDAWTVEQTAGLSNSRCNFQGTSVYCNGYAGRYRVVRRWDEDTGPVNFIDYGSPDHVASNLATDEKDMVWLEAFGPATQTASYTSAAYFTSPYVKDKANLVPRRLRSESPNALAASPMAIACGHFAMQTGEGIRIGRISDGASWFLANDPKGWGWLTTFAMTCDHLYFRAGYKGTGWMARIPLANLGPATPAD